MQLQFTKMHGLGNDFMVVKWPANQPMPDSATVRRWGDRRTGVGFDSLLVLGPPATAEGVASYRVLNADGDEAQQCGNGARCLGVYLTARHGKAFSLDSKAGSIDIRVGDNGVASVNLGEPSFEPADLPFSADVAADQYTLSLDSGSISFGIASMGNPHAVISVDSVETAPVGILGPELGRHSSFPQGVNVGFMQRIAADEIRLRVFERGVGETLACGTGAAAAVAVGNRCGSLGSRVTVGLPGGQLVVEWQGPGHDLWQTGPTTTVYEGRIKL